METEERKTLNETQGLLFQGHYGNAQQGCADLGYSGSVGKSLVGVPYGAAKGGLVELLTLCGEGCAERPVPVGVTSAVDQPKEGVGVVWVKAEPKLVVFPLPEEGRSQKINTDPAMPALELKAQLKSFTGGSVQYEWTLTVKWRSPEPRDFEDKFAGQTIARNSDTAVWKVAWEQKTRGGNDIQLKVKATGSGKTYEGTLNDVVTVIGENPTVAQVKEGLSLEEQVIVYMESSPKWKHFSADGFPIFGAPRGYGLMQLDNPRATDEQVWNWRENRAAGQRLLSAKNALARGYATRIANGTTWYWKDKQRTKRVYNDPVDWSWYPMPYQRALSLTEGSELLRETFQRYNGGVYWRWVPERAKDRNSSGRWERCTTESYGDDAWSVYDDIANHNRFPLGWN